MPAPSFRKARRSTGFIGLDVLEGKSFVFSYINHTLLILPDGANARFPGCAQIPIRLARQAEGLSLTVDLPVHSKEGTLWFEMDSGNTSSETIVGKHAAASFGLTTDPDALQHVKGSLVGGTAFEGDARVLNTILDGNLGISFLSKHDVAVDLARKVAWILQPSGANAATAVAATASAPQKSCASPI